MEQTVRSRILAIFNVAALIVVLVINTLANSLPLNGVSTGELSDSYPNLFVPSGITFAIWGVIYLLLIGFIVYQALLLFHETKDSANIERITPFFILSSAANTLWIVAWHWRRVGLSVFLMIALLCSLITIYLRINDGGREQIKGSFLFLRLPFSVYLGWITIATVANITALLVNIGWNRFGLSEAFWTISVLVVAILITLAMLLYRKDIAYGAVVIWSLYGILKKRSAFDNPPDRGVEITAIIGLIILGILTLFTLVKKVYKND